jgi:prevent-host-death family protein
MRNGLEGLAIITKVVKMKTTTVTATEANRSFSKLLRAVERGERVEITSHGRTVAVLAPAEMEVPSREQRLKALEKLKKRWATQPHVTIGPWTREELYERD